MSFFRDLVAEVQKELNAATAEFKTDFQNSTGFSARPVSQGTHAVHGSEGLRTASGVIEHPTNPQPNPVNRTRPAEQRPQQQAKKRRKKPQQQTAVTQQQAAAATQQRQAPTQARTRKATLIHPHKLVANLTPAVARSSIIMSEVLGPPVSKRQRRGWN